MSRDPARALMQFFGGRICLDFANTVDWRTSDEPQELLPDYPALLAWSTARRTLARTAIAKLQARCAQDAAAAAAAAAVLRQAHALRSEIWRLADALRQHERVQLAPLNRMLAAVPAQPRLISDGDRLAHDLPGDGLDEPLRPVLWSLTALLVSDDAARVGCCQAQGCGWFFVDESPNHTRMWCSSENCGNRERARRAYAKRSGRSARRPP
jgi:predicted RNA-binding Zn ribbon-like protein